ncbi:MAG: hypothetical protein ACO3CQ_06395 [Candidatus Nanopelagicaceae bacterium]
MTEPEFELNEKGEVSKITINSSGSDWDKALKNLNENAKKWADEEIMKIQCKVIHDIINKELE